MKRLFLLLFVLVVWSFGLVGQQANPAVHKLQDKQIQVDKNIILVLPKIMQIEPLYDDCQLIFYVKGASFGAQQGTREIRMASVPFLYKPQITAWSATKIDCKLQGEFELGRNYQVYIYNTTTNKIVSNQYMWLVKTQLKMADKGYHVGEAASVAGHLLGPSQAGRQLQIGHMNAVITQWTCEDILFTVPILRPGIYKVVLKKGPQVLSTETTIKIVQ